MTLDQLAAIAEETVIWDDEPACEIPETAGPHGCTEHVTHRIIPMCSPGFAVLVCHAAYAKCKYASYRSRCTSCKRNPSVCWRFIPI